jgi:hypothetical protein
MVQITFTNIIVDDFNYGKRNPNKRYIYFLTHMHSGVIVWFLKYQITIKGSHLIEITDPFIARKLLKTFV